MKEKKGPKTNGQTNFCQIIIAIRICRQEYRKNIQEKAAPKLWRKRFTYLFEKLYSLCQLLGHQNRKKTLKVKGEKNRPEGEDDEEIMIIKIRERVCMLNWTHIFEYSLHLPTFLYPYNSSLCSFLPSFICLFLPSIHRKCF